MNAVAALLTPLREGGIGVIGLRGSDVCTLLHDLFISSSGKNRLVAGRLHYGKLCEGEQVLDEVILLLGEEGTYGEINCHGGILATHRILEALKDRGVQLIDPHLFPPLDGENRFAGTPEKEACSLLSQALTRRGINFLHFQLKEGLTSWIHNLRSELQKGRDDPGLLKGILQEAKNALARAHRGIALFESQSVAIVGKPNVGKSSLLNVLLNRERVLVSPSPGTTRDAIEEILSLHGYPIRVIDSAGIRDTAHPVERLGVEEAWQRVDEATLALLLLDNSLPIESEDLALIEALRERRTLPVINKSDCPGMLTLPETFPWPVESIPRISLLSKTGLEYLEHSILGALDLLPLSGKEDLKNLIFTARQRNLLSEFVLEGNRISDGLPRKRKVGHKTSSELESILLKILEGSLK